MAQQPPVNPYQEFIDKDRKAYYLNLVYQQRVPPQMAMQMTFEKFGAPKTQQELAKDKASQEQKSGIAQTVGSLAGMLGASQVSKLFGSKGKEEVASEAIKAGAETGGEGGGFLGSLGSMLGFGGTSSATGASAGTAGTSSIAAPKILGASQVGAPYAATTTGGGLASVGSVALPVAAAALIANDMYESGAKDIIKGKEKSEDWANMGLGGFVPGANIALRLMGKRSIGKMVTGGKSDAQENRDMFRKDLRNEEIADKDWNVTLADGTKYNIGLDGKAKLQNMGENVDKKTDRRMWDVDFSNPLAKKAVDLVDAKVRERYGGIKGVAPEQFTGMLVNAITSNAKNEQDLMANYNTVLGKSSFAGGQLAPQVNPQSLVRPKKGEVLRVSPGLYRTDTGRLQQGSSMRQALERAYKKGK